MTTNKSLHRMVSAVFLPVVFLFQFPLVRAFGPALPWTRPSATTFLTMPQQTQFNKRTTGSSLWAMPVIPDNMEKYTQLPVLDPCFTATTIPEGLKKDHSTRDGTWGVLRILKGKLGYTIEGDDMYELTTELPGIIEPNKKHSVVALTDDVEFVVEFHRDPTLA